MKQIFILPFCLSFLFINTLYSKTEAKTTPNNKTTQETQDTNNNTQTNSLTIKLIFNRKSSTPPLWHLNFGISTPISEAQLQYEGKIPDMDFYYQYDSKHITKTESSITFDMMINDKTPNIIFSIPGIEEGWILKPKDSETIYQAINKYNVKEIKLTLENLKCIKRDEQKTLYTIKTTKKYIFFGKKETQITTKQITSEYLFYPLKITNTNAKSAFNLEYVHPYLPQDIIEKIKKETGISVDSEVSVGYPQVGVKKEIYEKGTLSLRTGMDVPNLRCFIKNGKNKSLETLDWHKEAKIFSWDTTNITDNESPQISCWTNADKNKNKLLETPPDYILTPDKFIAQLTEENIKKIINYPQFDKENSTLKQNENLPILVVDKENNQIIQSINGFFDQAALTIKKFIDWDPTVYYLDVEYSKQKIKS